MVTMRFTNKGAALCHFLKIEFIWAIFLHVVLQSLRQKGHTQKRMDVLTAHPHATIANEKIISLYVFEVGDSSDSK